MSTAAADDISVPTESRAPEVVAEHHDAVPARADVVGGNEPPGQRRDAERLKRLGAGETAADALGAIRRAHHERPRARHARDSYVGDAAGDVVHVGDRCAAPVGPLTAVHFAQRDQSVSPGERKRAQDDAVHDAEDGRGDADRKRQRRYGDGGYRAMFGERSDGESHVRNEGTHDILDDLGTRTRAEMTPCRLTG
jgi:hypothetical protein